MKVTLPTFLRGLHVEMVVIISSAVLQNVVIIFLHDQGVEAEYVSITLTLPCLL